MTWYPMHQVLAKALVSEAHAAAPHEMCGFVLDEGKSYIPVPNCHPEPERHFTMDEQIMLELLTHNAHVVTGIYHSHPRGRKEPSDNDLGIMRAYPHFQFWIVTYNNVYEWELIDDQVYGVRRDVTAVISGMAYPLLTTPAEVRRDG